MNSIRAFFFHLAHLNVALLSSFFGYHEPYCLQDEAELISKIKEKGISSLFFLSGRSTSQKPFAKELIEDLEKEGVAVHLFLRGKPNPTVESIEEMASFYRENNCQAILTLGGGSSLDSAKALQAKISNPSARLEKMGLLGMKGEPPLHFALPTTAGSGSEATLAAVLTWEANHRKFAIASNKLIPDYALLEKSLLMGAPNHLIAETGMDALTHSLESYFNRFGRKSAYALGLDATKAIGHYLPRLYEDNADEEAAAMMLEASYNAGVAFSMNFVGYVHALAHALGGMFDLPHGYLNAILLPLVLKKYGKSIEKKSACLCKELGLPFEKGKARFALISHIEALQEKLGIPKRLDLSLTEETIKTLVGNASKEANWVYPVPRLFNKKELAEILRLACKGTPS